MESGEALQEDLPQPGWKERLGAVRRAASALFTTRAEIFREELSEKGSLFVRAAIGLALAAAFGVLALLLLTALLAAVLSRLLGGPIAGIAATLVLYVVVAAVAGILGGKTMARVRPFAFPATRDELRKDFDAVKRTPEVRDEGPAGVDALAAERASVQPDEEEGERVEGDEEDEEDDDDRDRKRDVASMTELEDRFRAGSE